MPGTPACSPCSSALLAAEGELLRRLRLLYGCCCMTADAEAGREDLVVPRDVAGFGTPGALRAAGSCPCWPCACADARAEIGRCALDVMTEYPAGSRIRTPLETPRLGLLDLILGGWGGGEGGTDEWQVGGEGEGVGSGR